MPHIKADPKEKEKDRDNNIYSFYLSNDTTSWYNFYLSSYYIKLFIIFFLKIETKIRGKQTIKQMLTKGTMPMLATYMINFELVHATALIRLEFPIWLIAADLRGFGLTMN